jgi:hypothetical protein
MITFGDDTPLPAVDAGHQHRFVTMEGMAVPTARLKTYIEGHLDFHASQRWPQLEEVTISWRGSYGYVSAYLTEDDAIPVCRLRYLGSDTDWGFALYQASSGTLRRHAAARRQPVRHPGTGPRLRPGPLPRRPNRLDQTPEGLTRRCTSVS